MTPAAIPDADLLDAGRRAFARWGFRDATVERIAQEAGVSRVTLHRRGVTRESLLAALTEAATADYRERMWPVLMATTAAPERLEAALAVLCQAAEEHMALLLALRAQSDQVFHEDGADATLTRTIFTEPLEHILAEGMRDESIRCNDAEESATVLFNLVGWTYIHMRNGHGWSPARSQKAVVDVALHGLLTAD